MSIICGSGKKRSTIPTSLEYEGVADDSQGTDGLLSGDHLPTTGARKKKKPVRRDVPHADVAATRSSQWLKPVEIKAHLDEFVIGQDDAKIALCNAAYNHYLRIREASSQSPRAIEIRKSNVLLLGPTGSGKTYLVQNLAKILDVPFASSDATSLTAAGYIGQDVESVLNRLVQAAGGNIQKAQTGIVFIDEIDKLASRSSAERDIGGEDVQFALLKMLEGTQADLSDHRADQQRIDTTNILFICGGAFSGIQDIVERRTHGNPPFDYSQITEQDLSSFGMMPELIGRLPVRTHLKALGEAELVDILTKPKNALCREYAHILSLNNHKLIFTPEALKAIAARALKDGLGARALRSICEAALKRVLFNAPSWSPSEITITEGCVQNDEEPVVRPIQDSPESP